MEEIINSKKAKPARGFVTVQLFDEFGRMPKRKNWQKLVEILLALALMPA